MAFQYRFEWDSNKAVANSGKHGIGFEQAATVFRDPLALSIYPVKGYVDSYAEQFLYFTGISLNSYPEHALELRGSGEPGSITRHAE